MTTRRLLTLALLLTALGAVGGSAAPQAAAAAPCWKVLLNDWLDGRIDKAYRAGCYRQAIKHLPEDVRAYSDAREDIERALLAAVRGQQDDQLRDDEVVEPEPAPSGGATGGETTAGGAGDGGGNSDDGGVLGTTTDDEDVAAAPGDDDDGGLLGPLEPSNADTVPVPLLVLAGLALLLLAAAGAGFLARRLQGRRARIHPGPPQQ